MEQAEEPKWKKDIPDNLMGDKLYLQRARKAFPLIVRQAKAGNSIYYTDLAKELEMPNPRNLNYVLGAIGTVVERLGFRHPDRKIPAITCLVVRQSDHLPGDGIDWFISKVDFNNLASSAKRKVMKQLLSSIFAFQDWDWVLEQADLEPLRTDPVLVRNEDWGQGDQSGGESEQHLRFKEFIAQNPKLVGLSSKAQAEIEFELPSHDRIDVCFSNQGELVGVEVKSAISDVGDIQRGLFQCVKYQALLEAKQIVEVGQSNCRVILAVEGKFPDSLIPMKNQLGISVVEVSMPEGA